MGKSVNIRPGVGVLALFPHMNYSPWFALAEFVDNSIQSYLSHREHLELADGEDFQLRVDVNIQQAPPMIRVTDNAAGIYASDYGRAFVTAAPPADASGLSQFGVGMKSASAWFGRHLIVESTALGEDVARVVTLDFEAIVKNEQDLVDVIEIASSPQAHGTTLTLTGVHDMPRGSTIGKIKHHLASIYRVFLQDGRLDLRYNHEQLSYSEPEILFAPAAWDLDSLSVTWRKDIDFTLSDGKAVRGYSGIRSRGSRKLAGFSLFRHDRLVTGSGEDTYRPDEIFGSAATFPYQRIFGELHLDGFDVTHTKDGFRWEESEDELIRRLGSALDDEPLPLIRQAWEHRAKPKPEDVRSEAQKAVDTVANVVESTGSGLLATQAKAHEPVPQEANLPAVSARDALSARRFLLNIDDQEWAVTIDIAADSSSSDWLQVADRVDEVDGRPHLGLRMNLASPFAVQFLHDASSDIEVFLRTAVALGLAEMTARRAGVDGAALVRNNVNQLLAGPLASANAPTRWQRPSQFSNGDG